MQKCLGKQRERLRAGPFEVAETLHEAGLTLPRHAHPSACFHMVLAGVYQEETSRGRAGLPARTIVYKPAGEPHENRFDAGGARTLRVEFVPSVATPEPGIGPVHLEEPGLRDLAARLHDELRRPDEFTPLSVEGLCLEFLARLGRFTPPRRTPASRDLVLRAARLIEARFDGSLLFTDLAHELGVSRSHLARTFRAHHGVTLGAYLRRVRVDRVRDALLRSDRSLAEIAAEAGFADQSHCARVFGRLVGRTPGEFRRAAR